MLTPKQKELLMFIHERLKESGVPPSFDEMKEALDLRSKSGIHRLITALEERGFVRRLPHRARAMEMLEAVKIRPTPLLSLFLSTILPVSLNISLSPSPFLLVSGFGKTSLLSRENQPVPFSRNAATHNSKREIGPLPHGRGSFCHNTVC